MLKPVVEDAHRAPEALLGEAASEIAIRRDEHGVPGSARASICGSSPDRSTGSSTRSGSLTTTTPSSLRLRA